MILFLELIAPNRSTVTRRRRTRKSAAPGFAMRQSQIDVNTGDQLAVIEP